MLEMFARETTDRDRSRDWNGKRISVEDVGGPQLCDLHQWVLERILKAEKLETWAARSRSRSMHTCG